MSRARLGYLLGHLRAFAIALVAGSVLLIAVQPAYAGGRAFAVTRGGPVEFTGSEPVVLAQLDLPIGSYAISGKLYVLNNQGTEVPVSCLLRSGGDHPVVIDGVVVTLEAEGASGFAKAASVALLGVLDLGRPGLIDLSCATVLNQGISESARSIKIVAIKVGHTTTRELP